ncbi:NETR-like protein [Mya arenaria]|uniref:Neurotrypsin n=1 Tax=Mya arenaria TaxID=6604 RepID=A0ABY7DHW5_MYAAR|nr:NETR-like protein [Mya arenaria]
MKSLIYCILILVIFSTTLAKKGRSNRHGGYHGRTAVVYLVPPDGRRIRLGGEQNRSLYAGNVEVFQRNQWGGVCDDEWNMLTGSIACRQLGFTSGVERVTTQSVFGKGSISSFNILLDDVQCQGAETSLLGCDYKYPSNCHNGELAGVVCKPNTEPILTGGVKDGSSWMWETVERFQSPASFRQRRAPKLRSGGRRTGGHSSTIERTVQVSIDYFKWFPGWLPGNINAEPSDKRNEKCLYLQSSFAHPDKSVGPQWVGYMFWMDEVCKRTNRRLKSGFRYMCERPREVNETKQSPQEKDVTQECYTGNGDSYRGTMAHTEKGTPCIYWALSNKHTPEKFPDKGLAGHNHCRNPDSDSRPWCYVDHEGHFGFCPVPECSDAHSVTTTTTPSPTVAPECPDNKFYCSAGNNGIVTMRQTVRETRTNETVCAKICVVRESYVCRAFSYDVEERKCDLSELVELPGLRIYSWNYASSVFELPSQIGDCAGQFNCTNGRCVDYRLVCNMEDNCGDFSDEQNCGAGEDVEVRLVGGDNEQSGWVEVRYLGKWGVICDDSWDKNDAAVVCSMLGYNSLYAEAIGHSKFGEGNGQFFLDEVNCSGSEASIADCGHRGWKVHDCRSFEVAGVHCHDQKTVSLKLKNGTESSGRVEITRNGVTGTVCDDSWDNNDAIVLCKMLGFRFGEARAGGSYGLGTGPIWLDEVECTGEEMSLMDCPSSNWGVSNCDHAEDAGAFCSNDLPQLPTLPPDEIGPVGPVVVQLVDGPDASAGRVELIVEGRQGTICDDEWDNNDATVICRMMGYSSGEAKVEGRYGPGSDRLEILFDDVDCDGTESSIVKCGHPGLGINNCAHGEDAGVVCYTEEEYGDQTEEQEESDFICGRRPREFRSRKKREKPMEEKQLAPPPKFERIIGGFTASKGFYPWQVGVRRIIEPDYHSHWCGGTILNKHWILSAAHCFQDLSKSAILVRTGDHDNKVLDDHEQEFELEEMISHPRYDDNTFDYDLALLKVKRKDGAGIKFNEEVQPACLPQEDTPYVVGEKCHISGWGKDEYAYPNMLKSARVPIIDDATCIRLYKTISPNMVCAGYLAGGIDSCSGDSGGPLVCEVDGVYTVMGATSFGAGCAEANAPGVYARVTAFLPWIMDTIQQFS